MRPTRSNIDSNKCSNPIGSDCVMVSTECGTTTLTNMIASLQESSKCCEGVFPDGHQSCYTGSWVDISSLIPRSGTSATCSWSITTIPTYWGSPQYKWTKEGDLKVRGSFKLVVTPTSSTGFATIPLVTLSPSCFPTGWTASQFNITAVDPLSSSSNSSVILSGGLDLSYPTGNLSFGFSFSNILLTTMTCDIALGGTTFNLA